MAPGPFSSASNSRAGTLFAHVAGVPPSIQLLFRLSCYHVMHQKLVNARRIVLRIGINAVTVHSQQLLATPYFARLRRVPTAVDHPGGRLVPFSSVQ
jgi:hypothetical protein